MARVAVVLMNLGGPDSPAAVRPFLYNLFSDPAIIDLPRPLRHPFAWLIARQRSRVAPRIRGRDAEDVSVSNVAIWVIDDCEKM